LGFINPPNFSRCRGFDVAEKMTKYLFDLQGFQNSPNIHAGLVFGFLVLVFG